MMGFIQDKIYNHLPLSLQNIVVSAFGYSWQRRRLTGVFKQELSAFMQRESFSKDQWKEYQTQQLRRLLLHCKKTVPYYQNLFTQIGLTEENIRQFNLDNLASIPCLEKKTLRKIGKTQLLSAKREKGGAFFSSSGSTGTPTQILYSLPMHQRISALYEARVRNFAGVNYKNSRAMIGGRRVVPGGNAKPPYYRYNFFEKQLYFSAYHISSANAKNYWQGLMKYKPAYMAGYAVSNYLLAKFLKENKLQPPPMRAVLTSSEKLSPEMRNTLSEVYQCKVFDAWSGVEWCGLISENEYGQLLVSPDSAILEIIKPDGSYARPGEEGELVCTGFLNYDQPLIRYKIGDVVRLAEDQTTKCGRNFPVIDEIIGRVEDVVIGKDGRQMVRFHSIFTNLPNVIKAQVVQEDTDVFTINVETDGLTGEERELIKKRMESQLGKIHLTIDETNSIPLTANGKFKAVISKVSIS